MSTILDQKVNEYLLKLKFINGENHFYSLQQTVSSNLFFINVGNIMRYCITVSNFQ